MPAGRVSTETDAPDPESIASFRVPGEQACLAFAGQGVRSSVVRLAPTVHGPGDYGFIPAMIAAARRTGVSAYIGDGTNRWPAIHRLDAASLFRLALEKAPAGSVLHGAGESAITFETIAPASSARTRALLGWTPTHATLLEDMETGDYFAAQAA